MKFEEDGATDIFHLGHFSEFKLFKMRPSNLVTVDRIKSKGNGQDRKVFFVPLKLPTVSRHF